MDLILCFDNSESIQQAETDVIVHMQCSISCILSNANKNKLKELADCFTLIGVDNYSSTAWQAEWQEQTQQRAIWPGLSVCSN
jgi:hypothetical protein